MLAIITENSTLIIIILSIIFALWVAVRIITRPGPPVEQISGDFTTQQLNQFDGQKKPQTFIAVKGNIYDVSQSWFYRKGAPYGKFAGHDASINLGKMSHDAALFDKWGEITLTKEQKKSLQDWAVKLQKKYRKVGVVLK